MASRGTIAKENVVRKIVEAFGNDYIGEADKKIYVWADDGGQRVQIAIAMTCPKVEIAAGQPAPTGFTNTSAGLNFEEMPLPTKKKADIGQDEINNLTELMARLGI